MAYASWSVVYLEQPSAAKWNILGTNDASFNDGTGIGDGVIYPNHFKSGGATSWTVQTYTPTWVGSGSNPAINSGTLAGRYIRIGNVVQGHVQIQPDGTTTFGTGTYTVGLPFTGSSIYSANYEIGGLIIRDAGSRDYNGAVRLTSASPTVMTPYTDKISGSYLDSEQWAATAPFTFGNADSARLSFRYLTD